MSSSFWTSHGAMSLAPTKNHPAARPPASATTPRPTPIHRPRRRRRGSGSSGHVTEPDGPADADSGYPAPTGAVPKGAAGGVPNGAPAPAGVPNVDGPPDGGVP